MSRLEIDLNLFDPAYIEDPFPLYDQVRAVGNVVWNPPLNAWVVVGFDEAAVVMADQGERFATLGGEYSFWFEAPNLITVDGALHRRLRGALSPLFTRAATAKWEQRVEEVVADLLQPLAAGNDSFDLIADFTMLPTIIVADMLGVPEDRYDDFRRWSHDVVTNLSFGTEDEESLAILRQASTELNAYFREEMERHRRERPDDLLTTMMELTGEYAMTDDEIRSTSVLLLAAGYDTTAKTMSNVLIALERNPDQRKLIADNPDLIPAAIEESMRWRGTVHATPRRAVLDQTLAGSEITAGEDVYTLNSAANRDPRRWERADEFDVTRDFKTNMGFGYGPHLCLGAPLARLETKVAIEQLLKIAPEYHLHGMDFGESFFVRGPDTGIIDVGARQPS